MLQSTSPRQKKKGERMSLEKEQKREITLTHKKCAADWNE